MSAAWEWASELLKIIKFLLAFFMSIHCGVHSTCINQLLVLSEWKRTTPERNLKQVKKITLVLQFSLVSTECQRLEVGTITFSPEKLLAMRSLLLRSLGQEDSSTDLVSTVLYWEALLCFLSSRSLVFTSASLSSVLRRVQDKLFTPHFPECILNNLQFLLKQYLSTQTVSERIHCI